MQCGAAVVVRTVDVDTARKQATQLIDITGGRCCAHVRGFVDPKRTSKDVRLFRSGHVQPVKRAECLPDGMLHMRVDHGRLEISVTEQ